MMEPLQQMTAGLAATAEAALGPGWMVRVGPYRFLLRDDEVAGVVTGPVEPSPIPHAPAWVAGLSCVDGRLLGVVDLGRFLGVCTAMPGLLVVPAPELNGAWALRVHGIEPAPGMQDEVECGPPVPNASGDDRPRPDFAGRRRAWLRPDGEVVEAEEFSLRRWLQHPRLWEALS